jgi:predicted secreted Zn-dependent protease
MWSGMVVLALSSVVPPALDEMAPDLPGFEYIEHRKYYVVDAVKVRDLRQQLRERRLALGDGTESPGRTTQRLETQFELIPLPTGCRMVNLTLTLEVTIYLPSWQPPEGRFPKALGERWDAMLAALTRHEEGHRDNALWAARGLHRQLLALGEDLNCLELQRAAQRERFKAEVRYRQRDQAYDRRTDHGVRQGSVL